MSKGKIYLLIYKDAIVYIGKSSVSVENRIKDHIKTGKMFDNYKVLETTTLSDMHWLEVYLITKYKPFYNKDCKELDEVSIDLGIDLSKLKAHKVANSNNSSSKVGKFLKDCSYISEKAEEEINTMKPKDASVTATLVKYMQYQLKNNNRIKIGDLRDWLYDNYNKTNNFKPENPLFCSNRFLKDNFVDFTESLFVIEREGRSKYVVDFLYEEDKGEIDE